MDESCRMLTLERLFGAGLNNPAGFGIRFTDVMLFYFTESIEIIQNDRIILCAIQGAMIGMEAKV
jgi:hypothetical protein